jgi:hypothetical protein
MPRAEHQLRDYFDAGVERITAEDVILRAQPLQERRQHLATRRRLRAAAIAAGAFSFTLLAFGGLAFLSELSNRSSGGFASGAPFVAPGAATVTWTAAALGAGGIVALVTWIVTHKPRSRTREGRIVMTDTIEREDLIEEMTADKRDRRQRLTIVALTIALVASLAWITFGTRAPSPDAAPAEIVELMEDYTAAWNAYDADALEALVTNGYRIRSTAFDYSLEDVGEYLIPYLGELEWQATLSKSLYATREEGSRRWLVSAEPGVIESDGYQDGIASTVDVWVVVEQADGTFLVRDHFFFDSDA